MVKECLVKINNEAITVVRYGDADIQFPSIHKDVNTVFVSYEGGKYFIVDKDYKPSVVEEKPTQKKGSIKKTTGKQSAKIAVEKTSTNEKKDA